MQTLQAPTHSPQHVSSIHHVPRSLSIELSTQDGLDQTASRHDEQALNARTVPADPYTAWLDQREAHPTPW
jgi:hypothetical protein